MAVFLAIFGIIFANFLASPSFDFDAFAHTARMGPFGCSMTQEFHKNRMERRNLKFSVKGREKKTSRLHK